MDKIVNTLTKPAKMIAMILLFAAAGFGLIGNAGGLGGGFMPVVGGLVYLLFDLAFWAIIPVLYVLKKDELVKYALVPVAGFWGISTIYNFLGSAEFVTGGWGGLTITISLFEFLIALAFLAVLAFGILYFVKKDKKFLQIAFCIFAGSLLFFVLVWALSIALFAQGNADWTTYFDLFRSALFIPFGLVFAVLAFLNEGKTSVVAPTAEETGDQTGSAEEEIAGEPTDETPVTNGEETREEEIVSEDRTAEREQLTEKSDVATEE